ncbi:MAG: cellulase family glycosylhydrolase [Candidatus Hydrogenedentes bacterium]|nr:cellulase family glycosylhydrolase [Candidatus Hydrogenedentota bacterium]
MLNRYAGNKGTVNEGTVPAPHHPLQTILTIALIASCATAHATAPITTGENSSILKDGKPLRAIGVNFYSAFMRTLADPNDLSYRAGFSELKSFDVPFVRFAACGYWPDTMKLYIEEKEGYFARMDGVVRAAEENGIGLIPSLFWNNACIPDLAGEPRDQWGNPDSKTIALMRAYTQDVVSRYVDSPAIWAWEFGNEFDLAVDLPNAASHRPATVVAKGAPATRSERDDLRFDMVTIAFREFGEAVRAIDPDRLITTGNSLPRATSHHQRQSLTWGSDARDQFKSQLAAFNPDPHTLISVHVYPPDATGRFGQPKTSYDEILALCKEVSRETGKPLFVGEWGAIDDTEGVKRDDAHRSNLEMITALERNHVPLAAAWVYDLPAQESFANITSENNRRYLLKAIQLANHRIKAVSEGTHSIDITGGNFRGALLDFVANKGRSGNGFNPLQHVAFRGENLFRDDATGLYFEHIFNGTARDAAISMFSPNNDAHSVASIDPRTAVMRHPVDTSSWGIESEMRYTLDGDAIDMEFLAKPTRDQFPLGYCAFMWASYMNHTRDRRIHFYGTENGQEGWVSFGGDTDAAPGFETGTIAFQGVSDLPFEDGAKTLNVIESKSKKFLKPFYYGLVDGDGDSITTEDTMAYVMMFDQKEPIRFALWNFIKNTSGEFDPHSPAWDWQYVIRDPKPGMTYTYRARMLYIPFTTRENILTEYERWAAGLRAR